MNETAENIATAKNVKEKSGKSSLGERIGRSVFLAIVLIAFGAAMGFC